MREGNKVLEKKDELLGSAPLGPLILKMVLPAVTAQIVNVLYSIVDRIYIGHMEGVGRQALTGIGVCFPILMLISAFSAFAGNLRKVMPIMPIFMAGIWAFGLQLVFQSAFMGMGQAKVSLFLALLRKIILLIPLALILPRLFGVYGIYYAEPISDIVAPLVTTLLFLLLFSSIMEKEMGGKK